MRLLILGSAAALAILATVHRGWWSAQAAVSDCKGNRKTDCTLRLERIAREAAFTAFDIDYFRLRGLAAGDYRCEVPTEGADALPRLRILDGRGKKLADAMEPGTVVFQLRSPGEVYVVVIAGETPTAFELACRMTE